jgi:hypothetical protein
MNRNAVDDVISRVRPRTLSKRNVFALWTMTAVVAAVLLASNAVKGLPAYEVHKMYYDESEQLVAEKWTFCDGNQLLEGDPYAATTVEYSKEACNQNTTPAYVWCWANVVYPTETNVHCNP